MHLRAIQSEDTRISRSCFPEDIARLGMLEKNSLDSSQSLFGAHFFHDDDDDVSGCFGTLFRQSINTTLAIKVAMLQYTIGEDWKYEGRNLTYKKSFKGIKRKHGNTGAKV